MPDTHVRMDPAALVRSFRATFANVRGITSTAATALPDQPTSPAPAMAREVLLETPADQPIDEAALPPAAQALLADFRAQHPDVRVSWERRMRADELGPTHVVEADEPLPDDDAIITVGTSATLLTSDTVRVVTEVYVGRLLAP